MVGNISSIHMDVSPGALPLFSLSAAILHLQLESYKMSLVIAKISVTFYILFIPTPQHSLVTERKAYEAPSLSHILKLKQETVLAKKKKF